MQVSRIFRHLMLPDWWVRRDFPPALLRAIESAIALSEVRHGGELCFALEANLPVQGLLRGQSPRERAIELFSQLRVWDTECNNGVLIYLQLVDRKVEIVADRGVADHLGQEFWSAICQRLESAYRDGRFEDGTLTALAEITTALSLHFPKQGDPLNELSNVPVVL